jgi:hypothetical protein
MTLVVVIEVIYLIEEKTIILSFFSNFNVEPSRII